MSAPRLAVAAIIVLTCLLACARAGDNNQPGNQPEPPAQNKSLFAFAAAGKQPVTIQVTEDGETKQITLWCYGDIEYLKQALVCHATIPLGVEDLKSLSARGTIICAIRPSPNAWRAGERASSEQTPDGKTRIIQLSTWLNPNEEASGIIAHETAHDEAANTPFNGTLFAQIQRTLIIEAAARVRQTIALYQHYQNGGKKPKSMKDSGGDLDTAIDYLMTSKIRRITKQDMAKMLILIMHSKNCFNFQYQDQLRLNLDATATLDIPALLKINCQTPTCIDPAGGSYADCIENPAAIINQVRGSFSIKNYYEVRTQIKFDDSLSPEQRARQLAVLGAYKSKMRGGVTGAWRVRINAKIVTPAGIETFHTN